MMPALLDVLIERPPRVFVIQTRGPLITRDIERLTRLAQRTPATCQLFAHEHREEIRRIYEPHCASLAERLETMACLRDAGIKVFATLAPILPCDPEALARIAVDATHRNVIVDPLHSRQNRPRGAVTRDAACRISERHDHSDWHEPFFQEHVLSRMRAVVEARGLRLGVGIEGFGWLAGTS